MFVSQFTVSLFIIYFFLSTYSGCLHQLYLVQLHQTPNMNTHTKRFDLFSHFVFWLFILFSFNFLTMFASALSHAATQNTKYKYPHKKDLICSLTSFFDYSFCFHSIFLGCLLERYLMQLRRAYDINRHTKRFDFFSHFVFSHVDTLFYLQRQNTPNSSRLVAISEDL